MTTLNKQKNECVLCGLTKSTVIHEGVRQGPDLSVLQCKDCGLVFLWPQPTEEELESYYSEQIYREDYSEPSLLERYRRDVDEARIRVRRLLPLLDSSFSLLEVGTGSGAFIDAVRPYVQEAVGIEPEKVARNWISSQLGLPMFSSVADALSKGKKYDLIVFFHVFEHIHNPIPFLENLGKLLKPGGKLAIEVPSQDDALIKIYKVQGFLNFFYQKAHLWYFSKETLALALAKAGFNATIDGVQRYDLSNHLRWIMTGQLGGQGYYKDIFLPAVDSAYTDSLVRSGNADTLWAIAMKNGEQK